MWTCVFVYFHRFFICFSSFLDFFKRWKRIRVGRFSQIQLGCPKHASLFFPKQVRTSEDLQVAFLLAHFRRFERNVLLIFCAMNCNYFLIKHFILISLVWTCVQDKSTLKIKFKSSFSTARFKRTTQKKHQPCLLQLLRLP